MNVAVGAVVTLIATLVGFGIAISVPTSIVTFALIRSRLFAKRVPGRGMKVLGPMPATMTDLVNFLDILEDQVAERLGERRVFRTAVDRMIVQMVPGAWFWERGYSKVLHRGRERKKVAGQWIRKGLIWVAQKGFGVGWGWTAFGEELLHDYLSRKGPHFDGDADHEGPKYKGWTPTVTAILKEVNAQFRLRKPQGQGDSVVYKSFEECGES